MAQDREELLRDVGEMCRAIIAGYANPDITHADYRAKVCVWAEDMLEKIAALPRTGEPVAWRWRMVSWPKDEWALRDEDPSYQDRVDIEVQPLFAHPVPEQDGWRDISTAPKDGTWFIGLHLGEPFPCEWKEFTDDYGFNSGWWDYFNQSFEEPTHWMPLPPLPPQEAV